MRIEVTTSNIFWQARYTGRAIFVGLADQNAQKVQ